MPNFIVNVYTSAAALLGPGPICHVQDPEVTERLDEVGSVSFSVLASDPRLASTIEATTAQTVELVYKPPFANPVTVGWGLVQGGTKRLEVRPEGAYNRYQLPSLLQELAWATTCPQHDYDPAQTLLNIVSPHDIADPMFGLLNAAYGAVGWDHGTIMAGSDIQEFNGESVLEAIAKVARSQVGGSYQLVHFRETPGSPRHIDMGPFGDDSGLRIQQIFTSAHELKDNPYVLALAGNLEMSVERNEIINWIMPLGALRVDAAPEVRLSLEFATAGMVGPYAVKTMTDPNGGTRYFITDGTSGIAYGERRLVQFYNNISTSSEAAGDLTIASDRLGKAALAYMYNRKDPNYIYRCEVIDCSGQNHGDSLGVGDTINLVYRGIVTRHGIPYEFIDIDSNLMVMNRKRRWNADGKVSYALELSSGGWLPADNPATIRNIKEDVHIIYMTTPARM